MRLSRHFGRFVLRLALALILSLLAGGALASEQTQACTYHVSLDGNDSASGGAADPWRTIQHAADSVRAGDTVCVHGGGLRGGGRSVLLQHGGCAHHLYRSRWRGGHNSARDNPESGQLLPYHRGL